jgi:hypothetical protein
VRRSGLFALLLMPVLATVAVSASLVRIALPTDDPDPQTLRPVGEPDSPPSIGLDLFENDLNRSDSHEEAWPGPPSNPEATDPAGY